MIKIRPTLEIDATKTLCSGCEFLLPVAWGVYECSLFNNCLIKSISKDPRRLKACRDAEVEG